MKPCLFIIMALSSTVVGQQRRVPVTLETEIRVPSVSSEVQLATEAFRADGSRAVVCRSCERIEAGWEIVDVTARTMTLAFSQIEAATVQPVRRSFAARMASVYERCEEAHGVPGMKVRCEPKAELAFGHRLMRVTLEPDDATTVSWMRRELLVAPLLNFVPLEERSWLRGKLTREKRTTALKAGDPDPALFRVPPHYRMVEKVSDLLRLVHINLGMPVNEGHLKMLDVKWEKEKAAVARGE